jgi:6-phosphofructokinase 1
MDLDPTLQLACGRHTQTVPASIEEDEQMTPQSAAAAARRMAILTSGGDAPGMNAAIRAATLFAISKGWEVTGIQQGYQGLVEGKFSTLQPADVSGIIREGGTILASARCPEFGEPETRATARRRLRDAGVSGLIVIGGNGSLAGAHALADPNEAGADPIRVIGIPASIDNDVGLTGLSIGVDTAMNTIVEACDKISDTASALERTFLVEVMGRDCGYLAMTAALASAADAVLFPESGRDENEIVDAVERTIRRVRARVGRRNRVVIIKAEGVPVSTERLKELIDERLRGSNVRSTIETRVTVLGHIVRGGRPTAFDRLLASRLAHIAVQALVNGDNDKMAAWMMPVQPAPELGVRSNDDPYCWLMDLKAVLAETASLLEGTSPLVQWRTRVLDEIEGVLTL